MYLFFDLLILIRPFYLTITFPQIKQTQTLSLNCIVNTADISKQLTVLVMKSILTVMFPRVEGLQPVSPVPVNIITSGLLFI